MSQRFALVCVFAAVVTTGAPSLAVASVEPLVVVVETGPGCAVAPTEVRQAIAAELRTPVRAPHDPAADEMADLLIVAVDRAEIRMSLRPRAAGIVSRAVPAPGERKARLQSIGWLAGNLARDQVGAIVAPMPTPAAVSAASGEGPEAPPPAATPATEPPRLTEEAAQGSAPTLAGVVAVQPSPAAGGGAGPTWSLTLGGGPSALWPGSDDRPQSAWPGPGIWYLELQRRAAASGLILGAVLEVGPDMAPGSQPSPQTFLGGASLVGVGRRFKRTFVEVTAGIGVEAYQSDIDVQSPTTTTDAGVQTMSTQSIPFTSLALYLRGQATAGLALSRSFDLLASIGGHFGSDGRKDHFLTSSLGVRVRFPQ